MWLRRLLQEDSGGGDENELSEFQFTLFVCIALMLVLMAGLMSGLTLGLMSLDMVELEVLKRSGTAEEKACAIKIMPVIKNQHMLLVTLLLCNAASTEALPIFIDRLANPVTAVIVSVSVVLVFGEIIPQAVCSRYGLRVGAYSAWFVRVLMVLTSPLSWPIGKLLDFLLGTDHSALFRRGQLKALVDLHGSQAGFGGTLSEDEVHVIRGALDLTSKVASKSMTPIDKVFMLSTEDRLDERTLQAILMSGHSRIPVHREGSRASIMGLILVKELVLVNPADNVRVADMKLRDIPRLDAETPMYDMLKLFETGKSHMAILTRPAGDDPNAPTAGMVGKRRAVGTTWQTNPRQSGFRRTATVKQQQQGRRATPFESYAAAEELGASQELEPVGIITIEDVIEELLQEEIIDETDLYIDNMQSQRVNAATVAGSLPPRLRQVLSAGLFTPRVGRLGGNLSPRGAYASLANGSFSAGGGLPSGAVTLSGASFAGGGADGGEGVGASLRVHSANLEMRAVGPFAGSGAGAGLSAALSGERPAAEGGPGPGLSLLSRVKNSIGGGGSGGGDKESKQPLLEPHGLASSDDPAI